MILFGDEPREKTEDPLLYYRRRIDDLSGVITLAEDDRQIAIYRAHQHGMPEAEIARWADLDVTEVHQILTELPNRSDLDELDDTREWVRRYRG